MTLTNILLAAELFLLLQFLNPLPELNLGNALGIIYSSAAILLTLYPAFCPALTYAFIMLSVILAVSAAFLTKLIFSAADNSPPIDRPLTLVVLGCRVKKKRPSKMLCRRLMAAAGYLNSAPQAVCIVSGGKGTDEEISEAQAMFTYLTEHGISADRIIMEDRSRTTAENLKFSQQIIKERSLPETTALVTTDFHQYRAVMLAKRIGITPYAVSSHTEGKYILTYLSREWLAIIAYSIIKTK